MDPLVISVDFDGVLHDPLNVKPGYKLGRPVRGTVEAMNELKAQGNLIVIHSVWADTEPKVRAMSEWCRYFNIPYDFITNKKPVASVYIDDHGYHFENWADTLEYVKKLTHQS